MSTKSDSLMADIFMAERFAKNRSDEINAKIKSHLKDGNFSNHAADVMTASLWEFCENACKNEIDKKLSYNWIGYSFFAFGCLSVLFCIGWLFSSGAALINGSEPMISYWWGVLAIPLGVIGSIYAKRPAETAKRLRDGVHGPVSKVYQILKDEIETPRTTILTLRNLRSDLEGDSVLAQIYIDWICARFTDVSPDNNGSGFIDSSGKTTSIDLARKGFWEAFGGFAFKILPGLFGLAIVTLIVLFILVRIIG